jgi:hypothetical protein
MTKKTDIGRTAAALVTQHRRDAGFVATLRAEALLAPYDVDGDRRWKRIKKAIRALDRATPNAGAWMNWRR